jgi:hypothetical protein
MAKRREDTGPKTSAVSVEKEQVIKGPLQQFNEFLISLIGATIAGALAGWLYALLSEQTLGWRERAALTFGAPLVLGIFLLAGTLHIGLMGIVFRDRRREWWGRLGGSLLLWALTWLAVFCIALYFPGFIRNGWLLHIAQRYLTPAWIVTTVGGLLAGNGQATGKPGTHLCSRLGVLDFLGHPAVSVAANGLCDEAVGAEVCRFFGLCAGVDRRSSIVCSVDWMCAGVGHYGVARGHQPVLDALVLPEPAGEVLLGSVERETITEPIYRFRPNRRYATERSSRRKRVRRPLPRSERILESGERAGSGVAGTEGGIVCDDAAVLRLRRLAGRAGQPDDKGGTAGGKAAHDRRNEQTRR